jgi:hypothetical protein
VSVNLTLRVAGVELVEGPAVAVDIGWRVMPDGSLRVGYWCAANSPMEPVRVPDHLANVLIVRNDGLEGEIRIPASWRALHERTATIRSGRDKDLERIKAKLVTWLEQHPDAAAARPLTSGHQGMEGARSYGHAHAAAVRASQGRRDLPTAAGLGAPGPAPVAVGDQRDRPAKEAPP